jgi:hypothetical protein
MSCPQLEGASPRISARRGQVVDLNVDFRHNGVLTDPFAVRHVEIYKTQVLPHNLITTVLVANPTDTLYPAPLCREYEDENGNEVEGTETGAILRAGKFHLPYVVPIDAPVPDIYFDVWYYYPTNPVAGGTEPTADELDDINVTAQLLKCCHRFWAYPEDWFCDDRLQTVRFGFEPLDQRFHSPETRPLEVGLMPLPLYDYNYNLVTPLIPFLQPTISIESQRCELLVDDESCRIGVRQGSYRSNPWVIQYDLDTSKFLKGTYQYQIKLTLPDGSTRVSRKFILVIA